MSPGLDPFWVRTEFGLDSIEPSTSNSKDIKRNTILTDLKILGILAPTKMLNIHILKYPHLRALYGVDIMLEKLPDDQVQVKILV